MHSEIDPFRRDGGFYPPHQPYSYPAAPPPFVNNYYNYTMPPDCSSEMNPGYPDAMPSTAPGDPYPASKAIISTPSIAIGKVVHRRQSPVMGAIAEMISASSQEESGLDPFDYHCI